MVRRSHGKSSPTRSCQRDQSTSKFARSRPSHDGHKKKSRLAIFPRRFPAVLNFQWSPPGRACVFRAAHYLRKISSKTLFVPECRLAKRLRLRRKCASFMGTNIKLHQRNHWIENCTINFRRPKTALVSHTSMLASLHERCMSGKCAEGRHNSHFPINIKKLEGAGKIYRSTKPYQFPRKNAFTATRSCLHAQSTNTLGSIRAYMLYELSLLSRGTAEFSLTNRWYDTKKISR